MAAANPKSDPDRWWHGGVFYQIYPRSYADSDGDGVGDLPGIVSKLDHLARLGITGVWLSPVTCSPNRDWGYDVSDYRDIDPSFGNLDDLDTLVREAGTRGIRILMDLVPNHTSDQHAWFVDSLSGRGSAHRDYYVWAGSKADGTLPNNWGSIFGGPAWEFDEASGQYYLHNFEAQQPDLNWWDEQVRREFDDIVRFWWDRGVAGFRIDVCNMMIKDKGLRDNPPATEDDPLDQQFMGQRAVYNTDRPEAHDILKRWRTIADGYEPARLLIGETNVEQLPVLMDFYGDGHDELHGGFNFVFINAPFEADALRAVVEETEALLPEGAWPIWTGSNHDVSRLATRWASGDVAKVKLALLLLLTLRGTPFLYQGDEIGLVDGTLQREDVLDAVGVRFWPYYKGRDAERTPMPWNARTGRRLHLRRRTSVAAHDRPGAVQRGRPGGRPRLGPRAVPPRHRGPGGQRGPRRRLVPFAPLPRGHVGLCPRRRHRVAQHVERDGVLRRSGRDGDGEHRAQPGGLPRRRDLDAPALGGRRRDAMTPERRRFVLCTTPAQGHTAPLVALAGRLVGDGHEVVFFTTEHYRQTIQATGARFVPFAAEDDAHDLMVANPERESSSKRGVRGVKDDLRRIFIGPVPGQSRDLRGILQDFAADCIVVDTMFLGAVPLALGPRPARPALVCIGVMPYASNSRDTAPFGVAFQPGTDPLRRAAQRGDELGAPSTSRWPTFSASPGVGWPRPARPTDFPATSSTSSPRWSTPSCRQRWRASNTRARTSPPRCASSDRSSSHRHAPSNNRPGGTSSDVADRWSTSPRARSTTRTSAGSCS